MRACLESHLAGDDHSEKVKALAKTLGYSHTQAVELWIGLASRVPLRHLPAIAGFIRVDLSVLVAFWIAEEARTDEIAEQLYEAAKPKVTDAEIEQLELARSINTDDDDTDDLLPVE